MISKNQVLEFAKSVGAAKCGIAPFRTYDELLPLLEKRGDVPFVKKDITRRINPELYLKGGKSIIVCLFPYRNGDITDVARYAKGGDYHPYVKEKLKSICEKIGDAYRYKCIVDSGGLCDKHLAYLAGLGFFGKNNLFYSDGLGSRFYIGSILTDLDLEPDMPSDKTCLLCDKCVKSCPGGALGKGYDLDYKKCISYLTQKNEPLTEEEEKLIKKSGLTLGCDICADVCPLNKGLNND